MADLKSNDIRNSARPLRVLLVDDHDLVAELVTLHLVEVGGMSAYREPDLQAGLARIRRDGPFDVVLLDIALPEAIGIHDAEAMVQANAPGAVVLFSGAPSEVFIRKAIDAGVRGCIPKSMPLKALTIAVELVATGQPFVSRELIRSSNSSANESRALGEAEMAVLMALGQGLSNKAIAHLLDISESAVKMHVRAICRKFSASNRTHAVILAKEAGLF